MLVEETDVRDKVRDLYSKKFKYREIAEMCGISEKSVCTHVRGLTGKRYNRVEDRAKARELYSKDQTFDQISKELDVSKGLLSTWLKDLVEEKRNKKAAGRAINLKNKRTAPREIKAPLGEAPYHEYHIYAGTSSDRICRYQLVHKDTKSRKYVSRAKYNMSVHLGRELNKDERVIRIDGMSDDISNLRLMTPEEYEKDRNLSCTKSCVICKTIFKAKTPRVRTCSSKCTHRLRKQNIIKAGKDVKDVTCSECGSVFKTTSNKALVCSNKCKYTRKRRLGGFDSLRPRTPKPPVFHDHECVVCENTFKSKKKNDEVCWRDECKQVIASYSD